MQVRLFKPSVGDEELEAIRGVFDRAWLGLGPLVGEFEKAWSTYLGAADSVGVLIRGERLEHLNALDEVRGNGVQLNLAYGALGRRKIDTVDGDVA